MVFSKKTYPAWLKLQVRSVWMRPPFTVDKEQVKWRDKKGIKLGIFHAK